MRAGDRPGGAALPAVVFANVSQTPFGNNLSGPVRALGRHTRLLVVDPMRVPGFVTSGGAAPVPVPASAVSVATAHRPTVVVCLGGGLFVPPEERRHFPPDAVFAGVALSDPQALPASLAVAPHFDLFYTQDPQTLAAYRRAGVEARRCDLAADPEEFRPLGVAKACDVVYVGKWTPYRDELVAALAAAMEVHVFTHAGESRWSVPAEGPLETTEALCGALNRARLVLDPTLVEDGDPPYRGSVRITPRAFMAAACGVPCFVEASPVIGEYFSPGVEIATFSGIAGAVATALELLRDDGARAEMGARARARLLRSHTWERRMRGLLDDVEHLVAHRSRAGG
jgi:spore maturation protein CgeB